MARSKKPVKTFPLKLALEHTASIIREYGYVSKKDASQDSPPRSRPSTSETLGSRLNGPQRSSDITPEDVVQAAAAMAWLKALFPNTRESDFDVSIRKLTEGGYQRVDAGDITKSDFGFVACIYATMDRQANRVKNKEAAMEAASTSKYMGKIKQRAEFFVKVVAIKYSPNIGCHIYNIKDRKGNLGVFFSNDSDLANVGECFLAKMTPKRHSVSDYHGGKETVFNRVKVVQNVGAPPTS